jgi:hypothetical protein
MSAAREKDQADFDLERFVDMFDEAMTSQDPRVINALRSLMMMVALTRPESRNSGLHDRNAGPLRRLHEDMNHLHRRIERMEEQLSRAERNQRPAEIDPYNYHNYPWEKYTMAAASAMAQNIDQDVLNRSMSTGLAHKINGGLVPLTGKKK